MKNHNLLCESAMPLYEATMITAAQIRAARGLLGWTQGDLAEAAGVSVNTVRTAERDATSTNGKTISAIERAFDGAGVEIVEPGATSVPAGPGVRLRERAKPKA